MVLPGGGLLRSAHLPRQADRVIRLGIDEVALVVALLFAGNRSFLAFGCEDLCRADPSVVANAAARFLMSREVGRIAEDHL